MLAEGLRLGFRVQGLGSRTYMLAEGTAHHILFCRIQILEKGEQVSRHDKVVISDQQVPMDRMISLQNLQIEGVLFRQKVFSFDRRCSLSIEGVLFRQKVFSLHRRCSLYIEGVLFRLKARLRCHLQLAGTYTCTHICSHICKCILHIYVYIHT